MKCNTPIVHIITSVHTKLEYKNKQMVPLLSLWYSSVFQRDKCGLFAVATQMYEPQFGIQGTHPNLDYMSRIKARWIFFFFWDFSHSP